MVIFLMLILLAASAAIALLIPREGAGIPRPPAPSVPEDEVRNISPEEARKRLQSGEGAVLIDVRTPKEFAEKRIPGGILLPIEPADEFSARVETVVPNKKTPVFVYCRSGRRSANAVRVMTRLGYENVYNLGGIQSWPFETEGDEAK